MIPKSHDLLDRFEYLGRVREDAGLRQEDIAEATDIPVSAISPAERGCSGKSEATLNKLYDKWAPRLLSLLRERRRLLARSMDRVAGATVPELLNILAACGYSQLEVSSYLGYVTRSTPLSRWILREEKLRKAAPELIATRFRMVDIHIAKLSHLLKGEKQYV